MTQRDKGHQFQIVDSEGYEITEVDEFIRKNIPQKPKEGKVYAVVYDEQSHYFNEWEDCQEFMQNHKGKKRMKKFPNMSQAEMWVNSSNDIDSKFEQKVMNSFRSLNPEQKQEALTELDSFFEMWQ